MTTTKTQLGTVEALMTRDPISVSGATTASELAVVLDENEISGVPVVDPLERVIGVVSRTDLLHRCVEGPLGSRPGSFLLSIAEGLGGQLIAANGLPDVLVELLDRLGHVAGRSPGTVCGKA